MSLSIRNIGSLVDDDNIAAPESSDSGGLPRGIRVKSEGFGEGQYLTPDDRNEVTFMQDFGLPVSFGGGGGISQKIKSEKASFRCDLCHCDLSSEETMLSHKNGQKHLKKLNEFEREQNAAGTIVDPNTYIRPTAPQKLAPKKIPIRLGVKLRETQEPLLGLDYVTETISYSNIEMEPHYECKICHNQGGANGMFNHVLGRGHREKYFEIKHDTDITKEPGYEVKDKCYKWRENDQIDAKITTIYSDDMYPWPSGKAPWSFEQDGVGFPPTYIGGLINIKMEGGIKSESGGHANKSEATKSVVHVKGLPTLHDAKALHAMFDAAQNIITRAAAFQERFVEDESARADVNTLQKLISSNIEAMSGIKLQKEMYLNTPNPNGKVIDFIERNRPSISQIKPVSSQPKRDRHTSSSSARSITPEYRTTRSPKRRSRSRTPDYRYGGRRSFKRERYSRSRSRSPSRSSRR